MRRNALKSFFVRALLVSLPLTGGGADDLCRGYKPVSPDGGVPTAPLTSADCEHICGPLSQRNAGLHGDDGGTEDCKVITVDGGQAVGCYFNYCGTTCGRGTDGVAAPGATASATQLGDFLAGMAHLEAASVISFQRLARELRAHGAPESLIALARSAAGDEVRHARIVGRLARRHGGCPPAALAGPLPTRSLEEMAVENAVEGCVRETFGALVASHQARAATDPAIRHAMRAISVDEQHHAELAWSIAAWAAPQLDEDARRGLAAARERSVVQLLQEIEVEPPPSLVERAGVPARAVARLLAAEARRELWS